MRKAKHAMSVDLAQLSKSMSHALRHAPEKYGIDLDEDGFTPIAHLLAAMNATGRFDRTITRTDFEQVIATSEKQRHEISGDKIRALYGHSIPQRIERTPCVPPMTLFHGTTHTAVAAILEQGLKPMGRQYVHLSADEETALAVGMRRESNPVLFSVRAADAHVDGIRFYAGNDKVWLADPVPARYLELLD